MVYGIYIHIPFCLQNCKYCHFITVPLHQDKIEKYQAAVVKEIALYAASKTDIISVDSIYFGGGTPSLLSADYIETILDTCRESFHVSSDCEISMEVNPGTLENEKSLSYKKTGVNRISMGAQSFNELELKTIGRLHTVGEISESVGILRGSGFTNINLDVLLGLPFQTAETWRNTLNALSNLDISHVSVYMLDLDEPCPLSKSVADGTLVVPDDDSIADLYLDAIDVLDSFGFQQYEISNFSKPGYVCRHNLKYWLRKPVIGFGLASHSFDGRSRYANFLDMEEYLLSLERDQIPVLWRKTVRGKAELEETLFLGLRLNLGIQWSGLKRKYRDERLIKYESLLRKLGSEGLVEWKGSNVRLTPSGMLLSNEIFQQFV
ncbi:MAG: radical SAM family heme chaperone HemW [Acidobacteriota bacterium]|jgi:oxygen-independent coproporphyrinogen-3 oxidase